MNALVWFWSGGQPAVATSPSFDDALRFAASLVVGGDVVRHVEVLNRGRVEHLLTGDELDKALEPFVAEFNRQAEVDDQRRLQRAAVQVRWPGPDGWPWILDRSWSGPDAAAEAEKRLAELGLPPERVRVEVWTDD